MKLKILEGNIFDKIKELPDNSIDLCITSPPYWGLRDYGIEGQLGSEPTMEAYLDNTLLWVKEVFRVLKPSGSFVLNIGDCFVRPTGNSKDNEQTKRDNAGGPADGKYQKHNEGFPKERMGGIYKTKQLLAVSHFAYCKILTETDFVCRGVHIWAKPNVPTPIRCRLKHSHEYLYWFVKDADEYYFDEKPWMKKLKETLFQRAENPYNTTAALADNINLSKSSCFRAGHGNDYLKKGETIEHSWRVIDEEKRVIKERNNAYGEDQSTTPGKRGCGMTNEDTIEHSWRVIAVGEKQSGFEQELGGKPQSEHVAPFPTSLIEPYVKSLCPQDGVILDPFLGSGTTMRVAMENLRRSIGIELNPKYAEYAKKRLNWGNGLEIEYEG